MSIQLKDVSYLYNEETEDENLALIGINLEIREGEFTVIVGHNGSGKSTLAKLLNGLYEPSSGKVTVDGIDTGDDRRIWDVRKLVGVVFQNPDNQMIATIIEDDVAFGPENLGLPPNEISTRVDWALQCVGMKEHRRGTPFRLSGGQKQRLAIAGVLAVRPKYLVLDESTSMLDPQGRESVREVLLKLARDEGITVIAITHYMEEAVDADRIIVIDHGSVGYDGDRSLFDRPDLIEKFHLELPVAARIAQSLRDAGIAVGQALDADGLVEALCR